MILAFEVEKKLILFSIFLCNVYHKQLNSTTIFNFVIMSAFSGAPKNLFDFCSVEPSNCNLNICKGESICDALNYYLWSKGKFPNVVIILLDSENGRGKITYEI